MKPVRFSLQERYSYFVKFRQDGALYGMYVWALDEDEAKSQVKYHRGDGRMRLDINNKHHQLIIGACANLVTEEGHTAREVMELLESAKSDLWGALIQLEEEVEELEE